MCPAGAPGQSVQAEAGGERETYPCLQAPAPESHVGCDAKVQGMLQGQQGVWGPALAGGRAH